MIPLSWFSLTSKLCDPGPCFVPNPFIGPSGPATFQTCWLAIVDCGGTDFLHANLISSHLFAACPGPRKLITGRPDLVSLRSLRPLRLKGLFRCRLGLRGSPSQDRLSRRSRF